MTMRPLNSEVAIIGAGFSGSLISLLLRQIGFQPVLIDRGSHPRFAIGESSTPVSNMLLEDLAHRYGLPRIAPFSQYGSWKRAYPNVTCGVKRGFSYFHHRLGQDFRPDPFHANELLVAASAGIEDADTHWLRSEFDQFLANEAIHAGVPYFDQTQLAQIQHHGHQWELAGERLGKPVQFRADLVIDASGDGSFLATQLGIRPHPADLRTRSRGLFSHFTSVRRWQDLYVSRGGDPSVHPYPCDDAALHHVFDGGWMWILPFDNGVTSAGFSLDPRRYPLDRSVPPEVEWTEILNRLPAVAEQFADANPVVPWKQTPRMQRRWQRSAGENWVMLPNTAAFHDPFYSTGNAFTLTGISRLMQMLERSWNQSRWSDEMEEYDRMIQRETEFIDLLVSGSFDGFCDFERMVAQSMFYFAASIWSETERRAGRTAPGAAFLCADREDVWKALTRAASEIGDPTVSTSQFVDNVRQGIKPINRAGLCDPAKRNLYGFQ